jgi:hypothetical protein
MDYITLTNTHLLRLKSISTQKTNTRNHLFNRTNSRSKATMNIIFKTGGRNVAAIFFSMLLAACGGGNAPMYRS